MEIIGIIPFPFPDERGWVSPRVKDANHALQVANDTSYGLSSSVKTRDIDTALKFAEQAEAGMVHINDCTLHDEPTAPRLRRWHDATA